MRTLLEVCVLSVAAFAFSPSSLMSSRHLLRRRSLVSLLESDFDFDRSLLLNGPHGAQRRRRIRSSRGRTALLQALKEEAKAEKRTKGGEGEKKKHIASEVGDFDPNTETEEDTARIEEQLVYTVEEQILRSLPHSDDHDESTEAFREALSLSGRTTEEAGETEGGGFDQAMQFLNMETKKEEDEGLPLAYDAAKIAAYWDKRPGQVRRRVLQLFRETAPFLTKLLVDWRRGRLKDEARVRKRAVQFRELLTRLGPTFVKLGQALSIRPDLVSPIAMYELQKLCDAVPSFDSAIAMKTVEEELGQPASALFDGIDGTEPIAAASLGQVYRCRIRGSNEEVAVKVQRPDMIRAVSLDLYCLRIFAKVIQTMQARLTNQRTDYLALLEVWAQGTYKELDYENEARNQERFTKDIKFLTGIYVPKVFWERTSRKVLTTEWIRGQKLAESDPKTINRLVKTGVECFLVQLLDLGFFHSDPHPGNLLTTEDGRLVVIDFGLMATIEKPQMNAMIASIIHLANRDYTQVIDDFIALDFLPPDVDRAKVEPVLGAVLDQALKGGGAKNINFQSLAGDLAQVTFDFPFKIPPYFALIIRALGVLEGIALTGDPEFKLIMEAYPYVSKRVMTDNAPELQKAFREILFKDGSFSPTRLAVLLNSANGMLADGEAFVDFDTLPDSTVRPRDAVEFVLRPEAQFLRDVLVDEVAKALDVTGRRLTELLADRVQKRVDGFKESVGRAARFLFPLPFVPVKEAAERLATPPFLPQTLQAMHNVAEVNAEERAYLKGLTELARLLVKGESGASLSSDEIRDLAPLLQKPEAQEFLQQVAVRLRDRVAERLADFLLSELSGTRADGRPVRVVEMDSRERREEGGARGAALVGGGGGEGKALSQPDRREPPSPS